MKNGCARWGAMVLMALPTLALSTSAGAQGLAIDAEVVSTLSAAQPGDADQHADGRSVVSATTEAGCTVTWLLADGQTEGATASYQATDDQDAPLTTVCSGLRVISDDAVAVLAWVDGVSYNLAGVRNDGEVLFETVIGADAINRSGAALGGGEDGLIVSGTLATDQDPITVIGRFGIDGAEVFLAEFIDDNCLVDVSATVTIATSTALIGSGCGDGDEADIWFLNAAGALQAQPLFAGTDVEGTFAPNSLAADGALLYAAGLRQGAPGLRWLQINANTRAINLDIDIPNSAVRIAHALQVAVGADGFYVMTSDLGALTSLEAYDAQSGDLDLEATPSDFEGDEPLVLLGDPVTGVRVVVDRGDQVGLLTLGESEPPADGDEDGVPDDEDNCPEDANEDQADGDEDNVGDACDNCPEDANEDQADENDNGRGDVCETNPENDADADGIANDEDNCPEDANPGQEDLDEDSIGDVCDSDADGDGTDDRRDNCLGLRNPLQTDSDADLIGDDCDDDADGDGVLDVEDNCPGVRNGGQRDTDNDDRGDACDLDVDGDEVPNATDNCPENANSNQLDGDGDGRGDACDNFDDETDTDRDSVPDGRDNCPENANPNQDNLDDDRFGDLCDPDRDGDNVANDVDNCPDFPNRLQTDANGNGTGDACEPSPENNPGDIPDQGETTDIPSTPPQLGGEGAGDGVCTIAEAPHSPVGAPLWLFLMAVAIGVTLRRR